MTLNDLWGQTFCNSKFASYVGNHRKKFISLEITECANSHSFFVRCRRTYVLNNRTKFWNNSVAIENIQKLENDSLT